MLKNHSMNILMKNCHFVEYKSQFDEHINESMNVKIIQ